MNEINKLTKLKSSDIAQVEAIDKAPHYKNLKLQNINHPYLEKKSLSRRILPEFANIENRTGTLIIHKKCSLSPFKL